MGLLGRAFSQAFKDAILWFCSAREFAWFFLSSIALPVVNAMMKESAATWFALAPPAIFFVAVLLVQFGKQLEIQKWTQFSGLPFDDAVRHFTDKKLNAQITELEIQAKGEASSRMSYITAGVGASERLAELRAERLEEFLRLLSTGEIRAIERTATSKQVAIQASEWASRRKNRAAMRGLTFSKGN
ncbi:MAG: hypothetical protein OJJ21_09255 [Ferrovibrio sp.]|uniref:hypothetical protein n=1 Tax=Ferrovibrio sp. TaxID=1917215 RepID=UPI00260F42A5|nr:hypothetical protein [Ferrovibrio sp.]MCW0233771.1 hypothetical protein [Ferrovibrio sp.]